MLTRQNMRTMLLRRMWKKLKQNLTIEISPTSFQRRKKRKWKRKLTPVWPPTSCQRWSLSPSSSVCQRHLLPTLFFLLNGPRRDSYPPWWLTKSFILVQRTLRKLFLTPSLDFEASNTHLSKQDGMEENL